MGLCCLALSSSGVIFLVIVGILVKYQPLYMMLRDDDKPNDVAVQCWIAAACYAGVFVLAMSYSKYKERKTKMLNSEEESYNLPFPEYQSEEFSSQIRHYELKTPTNPVA